MEITLIESGNNLWNRYHELYNIKFKDCFFQLSVRGEPDVPLLEKMNAMFNFDPLEDKKTKIVSIIYLCDSEYNVDKVIIELNVNKEEAIEWLRKYKEDELHE